MKAKVSAILMVALLLAASPASAEKGSVTSASATPATDSDVHVVVTSPDHFPVYWDALQSAFWSGLPAAVADVAFALWISNRWDLAKKRNGLDLELTREYYDAIGTFKALGRRTEILRKAQWGGAGNAQLAAHQQKSIEQAVELEGRIDAILAKLILEDCADTSLSPNERRRRRRLAGLLRLSVRTLR